jgi:hypothetical protein
MADKRTKRIVATNILAAELLEEEASRLPVSEAAKASILLRAAQILRSRPSMRTICVIEEIIRSRIN